jgi:hypothetical protein
MALLNVIAIMCCLYTYVNAQKNGDTFFGILSMVFMFLNIWVLVA